MIFYKSFRLTHGETPMLTSLNQITPRRGIPLVSRPQQTIPRLKLAIRLLLTSLRPIAAKVASPNRHRPLRLGRGNWSSCPKCVIRDRSAEPPSRAESRPECLDPNWRRCAVPASVALRSRSRRFNVAQTGQTRDPAPKLPEIWRMSGYAFLALTEERRS